MASERIPTDRWARLAALGAVVLAVGLGGGCASAPALSADGGNEQSVGRLLSKTSPDGHRLRQVPADEAPSVQLEVEPDPDSGWNVHLTTKRFAFTPEQVGGKASPGQGHAHLYLDGEKVARLYSDWHYLSADAVAKGEHTLTVQLNANDHTAWAVNGNVISDSHKLASTGEPARHEHGGHHGSHRGGRHGSQQGERQAAVDVEVDVRVSGDEVMPAPGRVEVEQGQRVRIRVTSDQADTIHVHGYDLEADVTADKPATFEFTAGQTGVYEVETHEDALLLTQLLVQ